MGFDVNFNKPIIKETQKMQDGGAGNLGYFEQERHQKEKEKSIFDQQIDSFEKNDEVIEEEFSFTTLIAQIILAIKDWIKKIFKLI